MSLEAVVLNRSLPVRSLSFTNKLNSIPTFDLIVPTDELGTTDTLAPFMEDIAVYRDGVLLTSGIVKMPSQPVLYEGQQGFSRLQCDGDLGRLYFEAAADVHFQNVAVSAAISILLSTAQLWSWGIQLHPSFQDVELTIDPRNRESLWAQISDVLKNCQYPICARYGGLTGGGLHQLQLGLYDDPDTRLFAVQNVNLLDVPKFKQVSRIPIKKIIPISGASSQEPVDLADALNIDPGLATDPDYPLDGTNRLVSNNTVTKGRIVRKTFQIHKTKNDSAATQTARNQTALSVYRRARREMEQSNPYVALSVRCTLPFQPQPGDLCYTRYMGAAASWDAYTEARRVVPYVNLDDWLRVTSVQADYESPLVEYDETTEQASLTYVYTLELSEADEADQYSDLETLADRLERFDTYDDAGAVIGLKGVVVPAPITEDNTGGGAPANCNFNGANTGRAFIFNVPTIPPGATGVTASVVSIVPSTYQFKVVQAPALPSTAFILCVSGNNGANWGVGSNATVTVRFDFL